jgi:hypothetical protein
VRQDTNLDPAVAAILGEQEYKDRVRQAETPAEKKKLKKTRQEREQRQRVTLELHPDVVAVLRRIAEVEGCSPAGACNYLLGQAMLQYGTGTLSLQEVKAITDSNRWQFVVIVTDLLPELHRLLKRL